MHLSIADQETMDISEIQWMHNWLIEVKEKENKSALGERNGEG